MRIQSLGRAEAIHQLFPAPSTGCSVFYANMRIVALQDTLIRPLEVRFEDLDCGSLIAGKQGVENGRVMVNDHSLQIRVSGCPVEEEHVDLRPEVQPGFLKSAVVG